MRCPRCGSDSHGVEDTRRTSQGDIQRRRRCSACREHFVTVERVSDKSLRVRKSSGRVVAFDQAALRKGMKKATARRYDDDELDRLVRAVFLDVYARAQDGVIAARDVGSSVLRQWKAVDEVSRIRYALVHLGRRDRADESEGWLDADDLRAWLLDEYPHLHSWRPPAKLVTVVKRDGGRQPFDRGKLERSIGYASKGRGSADEVRELASRVAREVARSLDDQPLVTSGQIGAEILRSLRDLDHIAYLRYASAVKRFEDPKDYEAEALAVRNRTLRRRRTRKKT